MFRSRCQQNSAHGALEGMWEVRSMTVLAWSRKAKPLTPIVRIVHFLSFTTLPSGLILWTKRMGKCICSKNTLLHLDLILQVYHTKSTSGQIMLFLVANLSCAVSEPRAEDSSESQELWEVIRSHVPNQREQRLTISCSTVSGSEGNCPFLPEEFCSVEDIYRLRRNIVERLLRHGDTIRWHLDPREA